MRIVVLLLFVLLAPVVAAPAPADDSTPRVFVLDLDDTVQPVSLRYLERGLRIAAEEQAALIVIEVDTPGGLLESLRSMTSAILGSTVPVAVYVTPSGARAASAGFFLLLAADIAAMAPGTNTGAAHPVEVGPSQRETPSEETSDDQARDASLDKAVEDAAALARSLAEARQRPAGPAAKAVIESASYTAGEARALGLIDMIATDRPQLLAELDGRTVTRFDGRRQTLRLHGAEIVVVERTVAERVLGVIASPQVAYLLVTLGVIAILFELMSPGFFVPGIAGVISTLLGLYGLSVLPVRVSGALMIAAGLVLLVAEVFITSYGVLALAGLTCFVIGSLILVDVAAPELAIGPEVVAPVTVVLAVVVAFLAIRAVRTRRLRVQSGLEAMIGAHGRVAVAIAPAHDGKVFVHGEYWTATASLPVPEGAHVRIDAIEGLRLQVSPDLDPAHLGGPP